jgi:hypothetical protein
VTFSIDGKRRHVDGLSSPEHYPSFVSSSHQRVRVDGENVNNNDNVFSFLNRQDCQDLPPALLNQAAYFSAGSMYPHGLFTTATSPKFAYPTASHHNASYMQHQS